MSTALNCRCGFAGFPGIAIVSAATDADSGRWDPTKRVVTVAPARHAGSLCMHGTPPNGAMHNNPNAWMAAQRNPALS